MSSGNKVDYCLIVNGAETFARPAVDVTDETTSTPAKTIEQLRRKSPGISINHTDFDPLRKWPIAVSVVTKRPGESHEQAELQIGVWQAAHWKMLEWQQQGPRRRQQQAEEGGHGNGEGEAGETTPPLGRIAHFSTAAVASALLVFLPAIIVVGHNWKFVATTREGDDVGRTVL